MKNSQKSKRKTIIKRKERQVLRKLKKAMEHRSDGDAICNLSSWNNPQRLTKGA